MKVRNAFAVAALALFAGSALAQQRQIEGSGHVKTENRSVGSFNSIVCGSAIELTVHVGKAGKLSITGDDNILPVIETKVEDGVLTIKTKDKTGYNTKHTIKISVDAKTLDSLGLHGASTGTVSGLKGKMFKLSLSGASKCTVKGSVQKLDLQGSGASQFHLKDLKSDNVKIQLSGASTARVNANKSIEGAVSGVSNLQYSGAGKVNINTSGMSNVSKA